MRRYLAILSCIIFWAILVYGVSDLPALGDPEAPANKHVAPRYVEGSYKESGVPNIVTAILANYRGYDTLGETTVIFTAGITVMVLIRRKEK
ncbi:MAG: hypothetical protein OIN89_01365 [Candidatus Methanoperedens sp.]|jgi:multicomponent Na+:H+ antiporter subunit B|nr:hypothetical protein [Candidatus Methanoperedens sp.]PKL54543.1 MAG: hypothetical protein CVV36_01340 [Candidatus Methanoperedenaceae archaeon HGW-Methanoperedenaceae-1]